jgi:hypothetical protein
MPPAIFTHAASPSSTSALAILSPSCLVPTVIRMTMYIGLTLINNSLDLDINHKSQTINNLSPLVEFMDQWVYLAAGLLAFWSAVMLAKQFLPKSFEVHPFLVMWKTTRFNDFIDRLGRKLGRFWKILWTFGIALGFGAMAYITFILGRNLYYIFFSTESASPVSLIIPGSRSRSTSIRSSSSASRSQSSW